MREFHELFAGRDDFYGTSSLLGPAPSFGEKREAKSRTVHEPVTRELYDAHLRGERSIGINPLMKDDTIWWFAIDVDDYETNDLHEVMARKIKRARLPLVVFTTKSGGAHLFCFFEEPCGVKIAKAAAQNMLSVLGLKSDTEIFPKQDESEGTGNWINLPYFGDSRYCMGSDGVTALTLREFLIYAHKMEIHPDDIAPRPEVQEVFDETDTPRDHTQAPPCIQRLITQGVERGGRDNFLAHACVYLQKAWPDEWQDKLMDMNYKALHEPLPSRDVSRIAGSYARKPYGYKCTQFEAVCDKNKCRRMEFGIPAPNESSEQAELGVTIDSLRQIGDEEDAIYIAMVDGKEVRLTVAQLLNFSQFKMAIMPKIGVALDSIPPKTWNSILNPLLANREYEDAPDVVGARGKVMNDFKEWTRQGLGKDGNTDKALAQGRPYYNFDSKNVVLRPDDFLSFVRRKRGNTIAANVIWLVLQQHGAREVRIDGEGLWCFPVVEPWFPVEERRTI